MGPKKGIFIKKLASVAAMPVRTKLARKAKEGLKSYKDHDDTQYGSDIDEFGTINEAGRDVESDDMTFSVHQGSNINVTTITAKDQKQKEKRGQKKRKFSHVVHTRAKRQKCQKSALYSVLDFIKKTNAKDEEGSKTTATLLDLSNTNYSPTFIKFLDYKNKQDKSEPATVTPQQVYMPEDAIQIAFTAASHIGPRQSITTDRARDIIETVACCNKYLPLTKSRTIFQAVVMFEDGMTILEQYNPSFVNLASVIRSYADCYWNFFALIPSDFLKIIWSTFMVAPRAKLPRQIHEQLFVSKLVAKPGPMPCFDVRKHFQLEENKTAWDSLFMEFFSLKNHLNNTNGFHLMTRIWHEVTTVVNFPDPQDKMGFGKNPAEALWSPKIRKFIKICWNWPELFMPRNYSHIDAIASFIYQQIKHGPLDLTNKEVRHQLTNFRYTLAS